MIFYAVPTYQKSVSALFANLLDSYENHHETTVTNCPFISRLQGDIPFRTRLCRGSTVGVIPPGPSWGVPMFRLYVSFRECRFLLNRSSLYIYIHVCVWPSHSNSEGLKGSSTEKVSALVAYWNGGHNQHICINIYRTSGFTHIPNEIKNDNASIHSIFVSFLSHPHMVKFWETLFFVDAVVCFEHDLDAL